MFYLISGSDKFRRQLAINRIKTKIFADQELNAFNFQVLENPELNELCASIQTPAFGSSNKIILVQDLKAMENKSEDNEVEKIITSFKNKPEENIVIFNSVKINGTLKLIKKIKKDFKEQIQENKCEEFKSWELKAAAEWLSEIYQDLNQGKKLKLEIAEFIAERVGVEESGKLYNELERLVTSGQELSIENLEKELDCKHDIFKFIKHIVQNQKHKAIEEFNRIVNSRELNIGILSILETSISNSLKLKLAERKFRNKNELASFVGISPGRLYYQQKEISRVSTEHLNSCLENILKVERQVKTGKDKLERAIQKDLLASLV